jgi:hypothetical protein
MKFISCNPLTFVESLNKSQRKALADILSIASKGDVTAAMLRKALERAK